jgi:hypothetical protein
LRGAQGGRVTAVPRAALAWSLLLALLAGHFAVHMLQLARKGDHGDFAAMYTAAHVFRSGGDFYDPQPDREHFGPTQNRVLFDTAKRLGTLHAHDELVHVHVFSYPPFTVLPLVPFTVLPFRQAAVLWQAVNLALLAASGWCLWRTVPLSSQAGLTLAAVALVYEPLENSLGLGQINQVILALTCAFLFALRNGHEAAAGVALGLAVALRVHPALLLLYLAWRRQWRVFAWGAGTALACTALAGLVVGWPATVEYATLVAPKYARAFVGLGNHSLTGWVLNTGMGLTDAVSADTWRVIGRMLSLGLVGAAMVALKPMGTAGVERMIRELAFLSAVLLLVTPNTTINHLVFTFIPLAVLLEQTVGEPGRAAFAPWLAGAVLLIGGIDDYYAHPLLAAGPAVVLGGIKTYGVALLAWASYRLLRHDDGTPARMG